MRIPLDFNPDKTRISVICTLKILSKVPIPVKFVVDTGSPETFIDEIDIAKIRIPIDNLELSNYTIMGGTKVALHKLGKAVINFRNDKDGLEVINFSNMKVAKSAWTHTGSMSTGTAILGMNFLLENKFHLFVDPDKEVAYIGSE